ncbi:hypothetical protein GPECTOR_8g395 [Gonium pectorale]|uniref:Nucleotide-diphospho-sugar transferase domain-containing protein n=1 Tax=Gonium pectorale TaxID=33097 RepID=A0A150GTM2_GONPE|nr:hypothetical protein GPECTOR_8g395 [Gonium pectorale]|eukprot:KXZ53028.1 hypothetical protein GPECTOR_8g395 [Gonium pectorale]
MRDPKGDVSCRASVLFTSGYCECENGRVVALVGCGMHSFTCFDRCRELGAQGMPLPRLMTCPSGQQQQLQRRMQQQEASPAGNASTAASAGASGGGGRSLAASNSTSSVAVASSSAVGGTGETSNGSPAALDRGALPDRSAELWEELVSTVRKHDPKPPVLLSKRTEDDDWLREGGSMPAGLAGRLTASLRDYIAAVAAPDVPGGTAPPATQRGRGIVMVSGGLRYMVSAWISIAMLRRSGSSLPVEMWFPVLEYPTAAVVEALRARGVTCRAFAVADLDQAGYALKVAAIMLSSFSEVLFLDADNFPLADPQPLFESEQYRRAGCVFWRDYWAPTAVPALARVLGIPPADMPASTFEAGQMLIDKRRHWRGMRVALYFNYYNEVWYNLFTDYMGWGDKETFYYAFLAAREAVYYVPTPTGSVGMRRHFCRRFKTRQLCREVFTGNSMVQYDLGGTNSTASTAGADAGTAAARPLFLHANLEKWSLRLPDSFSDYVRRWQLLQPGGEEFPAWSERELGLDLERYVFDQARSFRCAPFFDEYYEVRRRHGDPPIPPLNGLHTLMPGIEFHQMYRLGHAGTYVELFERSALDTFLFRLGVASRTVLPAVKRALRRLWGGKKLARLLFKLERRLRNGLLATST